MNFELISFCWFMKLSVIICRDVAFLNLVGLAVALGVGMKLELMTPEDTRFIPKKLGI